MSGVFVHGLGAVSPAGWGLAALRDALAKGDAVPTQPLAREGWPRPLPHHTVPAPNPRPPFLNHARLRRASPISHYAVAAGLEALGSDAARIQAGQLRLGVVLCVMSGCVSYSRRFYDETLKDPATASPLVFPETVFNAPASHLAAVLNATSINYTLVGDPGTFLQGLALAAQWLLAERVDGCVVIGAEEPDWLTAEAFRLFGRNSVVSSGSGALYLRADHDPAALAELAAVSEPHNYSCGVSRREALRRVRVELGPGESRALLCDSRVGLPLHDAAETAAWSDWPGARLSPKALLGEGLAAASAWQCVAGIDTLARGGCSSAAISVAGCNQQAIGARFQACPTAGQIPPSVPTSDGEAT